MSDSNTILYAFSGGGTDNYWGNFAGTNFGVSSYNPWSTSGPTSSGGGSGYAAPNISALLDQYHGRASPNTIFVIESNNFQFITQGTEA